MKAVIIGYSGHAYVVADVLLSNNYQIIGYCETEEKTKNPYHLKYLGSEYDPNLLSELRHYSVFLGLGSNKLRASIHDYLMQKNISCPATIHDKAFVSKYAAVGEATIVMPGAVINSMAKIGKGVICNSACIIEHECIIGDYVHIAPGAVLAGNVIIGTGSFIGANTVVRQGIIIGDDVIIGAGSVVTKNVDNGAILYGNPAKVK